MRLKFSLIMLALIGSVMTIACNKDDNQTEADEAAIQSYLTTKGLTAQKTAEGVYYIIEEEGTGVNPTINNNVTVDYEGFLLNDTKFDSSIDRGQPSTFPLSGVIQGWQIGIPLFKVGGKGKLIIPSRFAYGSSSPSADIPANSVLVFNVTLLDVQ